MRRTIGLYGIFVALAFVSLIFAFPQNTSASNLKKAANNLGLVGYWSFEDGSGTKATDFSGNGNEGTLTNGPTFIAGKHGKALNFDGSNDYVAVNDASPLRSTDITIAGWIKGRSGSASTWQSIVTKDNGNNSNRNYWLGLTNGGGPYGNLGSILLLAKTSSGVDDVLATGGADLRDSQWHFIVAVIDDVADTSAVYVDGVSVGTDTHTGTVYTGSENFEIGRDSSAGIPFDGAIDDLRIYNRVLSGTEITALYGVNQEKRRSFSLGLLAGYSFDEPSGTTVYDVTNHGYDGTTTGSPTRVASVTSAYGKGFTFDGTSQYINTANYADNIGEMTVSAWIKSTSNNAYRSIVAKMNNIASAPGWFLGINAGSIDFAVQTDGSNYIEKVTTTDYTDNTWHHVVGTLTGGVGGTLTIYVDGSAVGVTTNTLGTVSTITNSENVRIADCGAANCKFGGTIDDVRVYNRAFSSTEVSGLYNEGVGLRRITSNKSTAAISASGLVLWQTFDGPKLSGTTATDSSTGGVNGTLTNGPVAGIGKIGQALSFDGVDDYVDTASNPIGTTDAVTFGGWVKPVGAGGPFFSRGSDCGGCGNGWSLYLDASSGGSAQASVVTTSAGAAQYTAGGTTTLADGTWYHVMGVWNPGVSIKVYVNGALEGTTNTATTNLRTSTVNLRFGRINVTSWFSGMVDDFRVYNRVLSDAEIAKLYSAGK